MKNEEITQGKKKLTQKHQDLFKNKVFLEKLEEIEMLPPEQRWAKRRRLCIEYNIDMDGPTPLSDFVVKGRLSKNSFRLLEMCRIINETEKWQNPSPITPNDREFKELYAQNYPVSININRDASQADIFDFIGKNWSSIEQTLREGRPAPRVKERTNQKRDRFIWTHQKKPIRELVELVNARFNCTLVYVDIHKIIYNENRRRNRK